jgi:hypothetical protein
MGLKAVIALFLGLVLQFSQAQSGVAALLATCGDMEQPMSCCEGPKSCPCLSETDPDQKPSPLAAAVVDLKWFVSKPTEPDRFVSVPQALENPAIPATRAGDTIAGYAGVPLAVAFCSFVI